MGDRISIQFINGEEKSPVLFSHWDGVRLLTDATIYVHELKKRITNGEYPLDRLEPRTTMVDYIRRITRNLGQVTGNYYLGTDEEDGDNSDNGHHLINLAQEELDTNNS